jgi:hypothetical protein
MLWRKSWMEVRIRVLVALGIMSFFLIAQYRNGMATQRAYLVVAQAEWLMIAMIGIMVSGAGIVTQPAFQAAKGLHGSTLFTLSLPVTRFRLLAVRASLGWMAMVCLIAARCVAVWFLFPVLRETATPAEMFQQAVTLTACATGIYAIPVLLATFLDDQWRLQGSFLAMAALWLLFNRTPVPASLNLIRAMGEGSPMLAHTMPWAAMGCSLGLAAILIFAALKIAERREY